MFQSSQRSLKATIAARQAKLLESRGRADYQVYQVWAESFAPIRNSASWYIIGAMVTLLQAGIVDLETAMSNTERIVARESEKR